MPPKRGRENEDINELRLRSRQQYLGKREQEQLALLRKQVAEEAEEERTSTRLSEREKLQFARNRETLRLAEERLNIDEGFGGFQLQDPTKDKNEVLTRRDKEKDEYVSEYQQWENEQQRKVLAQAPKTKPGREREEDWDFVFDESTQVKFMADAIQRMDPDKQALLDQLNAAESKAKTIQEQRESLPVYQYRDQFLSAIADHSVIIVTGQTGSGKTTQLTQFLYEAGYAERGLIGCTQPRRVAAMSVAARVAEEMGSRLGDLVGYNVRFEQRFSEEKTKILYCTDGLLFRILSQEFDLASYSVVILDEAHERTVATDLLMALLKDICRYRPDFRLIISSATLNAQQFSSYFSDAPILSVPGRLYDIKVNWLQTAEANWLKAAITTVWQIHLSQDVDGDILVFCSGQDEIDAAQESIESSAKKLSGWAPELRVTPIYGNLPAEQQQRIFEKCPPGVRKCVLATNIAETSLTIPGIVYVIDSGYEKQSVYEPRTGTSSLMVTPCSRASADQRSGRAGRERSGMCFRLYSKRDYYNELPEQATPEIQRTNLASLVLSLKVLGIQDLINFDFLDPPSPDALMRSLEELYALGALDDKGTITRVGRKMAELPLNPQLAKVILAADTYGCVEECLTIVAMLDVSGALFFRPRDKRMEADRCRSSFSSTEGGDIMTYLNVYNQFVEADYDQAWCKNNFLHYRGLNRARDILDQLQNLCDRIEVERSSCGISDHVSIRKAFLAGYFQHTARLQRDGQSYQAVSSRMTLYIHPSSSLKTNSASSSANNNQRHYGQQNPKWIAYHELVVTSKEYARSVFPIQPEWLMEVAPHFHKAKDLEKLGVDRKVGKGKGKVGLDGK